MAIKGKLHVDKALSSFAINWITQGNIADDVLPIVGVQNETDLYDVWEQADVARVEHDLREKGGLPSAVRIGVSSDNFHVRNYALRVEVYEEDMRNADASKQAFLERGKVAFVVDKLRLSGEDRLAALLFQTAAVGSSTAVVSVWTGAGADPVGDIFTAINNVQNATGFRPTHMTLGIKPWDALVRHATTIDKTINPSVTGGGMPGISTKQGLMNLFEFEDIFVGRQFKNTQDEEQTKIMVPVWSNHCLVYFRGQVDTIGPKYGAIFNWDNSGVPRYGAQRHKPDTTRRVASSVTVHTYQDEKVTASELGFLLTGATTN